MSDPRNAQYHTTSAEKGASVQAATPEPSDEKDWEIINHADLYDECLHSSSGSSSSKSCGGMSAAGSFKIGKGDNKKEVFSFHFSTRGRCNGCVRRYSSRSEDKTADADEDEETVVGDDDCMAYRENELMVLEGKGLGAT